MSGIERDEVMAELEGGITGLFDLGVRLAEMGVREPIVMRSDFLTLTLTFDGAEPLATAAALRERAEAAERGSSPCVDDDGTPFASARTWRAAHAAAEARASLLERERDEARVALRECADALDAAVAFAVESAEIADTAADEETCKYAASVYRLAAEKARAALPPTRGGGNEGRGTGNG
jgi:hypothetical protein